MKDDKIFYILVEKDVDFTTKNAIQLGIPFVRWDFAQGDYKGSIFHVHVEGIQNQHNKERVEKMLLSVFSGRIINLGEVSELTNVNQPAEHNLKGVMIHEKDLSDQIVASQLGNKPPQPIEEKEEENGIETLAPLSDLLSKPIPPIEWLVDRIMVKGGITIFAGEPKSGKTFLAQVLALCLVEGKPFMDVFQTKPCRVLYIDEENGTLFVLNRFKSLVAALGAPQKLDELIVGINNDVKLDTQDTSKLYELVSKYTPDVVIIDSIVRCMVGDEDRATDVRKVFETSRH